MADKKKRRKSKPAAPVERINQLALDILSAVIAGLIVEIIKKWFF